MNSISKIGGKEGKKEMKVEEELGRKRNGIKRSAGQILGYC